MVRSSLPNGMYLSAGGGNNPRFRSIPKTVSKFEMIERSIDEAKKRMNAMNGEEYSQKVNIDTLIYSLINIFYRVT